MFSPLGLGGAVVPLGVPRPCHVRPVEGCPAGVATLDERSGVAAIDVVPGAEAADPDHDALSGDPGGVVVGHVVFLSVDD